MGKAKGRQHWGRWARRQQGLRRPLLRYADRARYACWRQRRQQRLRRPRVRCADRARYACWHRRLRTRCGRGRWSAAGTRWRAATGRPAGAGAAGRRRSGGHWLKGGGHARERRARAQAADATKGQRRAADGGHPDRISAENAGRGAPGRQGGQSPGNTALLAPRRWEGDPRQRSNVDRNRHGPQWQTSGRE